MKHSATTTDVRIMRKRQSIKPKIVILEDHPLPKQYNDVGYRDLLLVSAKDE